MMTFLAVWLVFAAINAGGQLVMGRPGPDEPPLGPVTVKSAAVFTGVCLLGPLVYVIILATVLRNALRSPSRT